MRIQQANWRATPDPGTTFVTENHLPPRLRVMRWVGKQTWIPRGHDWMLRQIWHPDSGRRFSYEVDFFGMRYRGDMAQLIDWNVFAYRSYGYCELSLLDALATEIRRKKDSLCFCDIGANVGHHTLFMSQRADRIVAFEPFAGVRELIEQKIALNHLTNVKVVPYALGETDEVLQYYPGGAANSGSGTFLPEEAGTYQEPIFVQVRNGDQLFAELALPKIDLMKVDVEGFEALVFRGLTARIHEDRPPILSEMSDRSRVSFGTEENFRTFFWDDAVFAEVTGRSGRSFQLKPFRFDTTHEMLIVPPEMGDFVRARMQA
jgi:FkbM family methyltransferase